MTEPSTEAFTYKLGFVISVILLWTLACMSTGFVIGTIFGKPTMSIENYNADGIFADVPTSEPVIVPEVKGPKHRRKR